MERLGYTVCNLAQPRKWVAMSTFGTLAERLAWQLERMGLSARAAALRVDVHPTMMARWVSGHRQPDAAGLGALMRLGISANWLLTGEGSPEPDRAEDAQYRSGKRDGLAEAREAVQRLEELQRGAERLRPSPSVARTIAQAQAAREAGPPAAPAPPRRRVKGE